MRLNTAIVIYKQTAPAVYHFLLYSDNKMKVRLFHTTYLTQFELLSKESQLFFRLYVDILNGFVQSALQKVVFFESSVGCR